MAKPTVQQLQEIKDLIKQTGNTAINPVNIQNLNQAQDALKLLRSELRDMGSDLDYINQSFKDTLNDISKQNTYLSTAKTSLRSISSLSSQIAEHKKGELTLDTGQIEKLKHKAKLQFDELKLAIKRGQLQGKDVTALTDSLSQQTMFNKAIDRTLEVEKKVNKEIGLAGVALKGFANLMSKAGLGDLSKPFADAIDKTKEARRQIHFYKDAIDELEKKSNRSQEEEQVLQSHRNQVRELSTQTNKYKNIVSSLKEQLTITNLVDGAIAAIITGFLEVNAAAVEFGRLTGQSGVNTAAMNSSLASSVDVLKVMAELTREMGMNSAAIFSAADLGRLAETKNLLGLSEKQVANLAMRSKVAGKGIQDYEKGIVGATNKYNTANRSVLAHGAVLQEVLNTSDEISLSLGGNPEKLTAAATAAMSLGLSLEKVDSIAASLTEFQSSISNELEAELLTGKQLNLEKAREYALSNDLAGLSKELAKNGASAAEFSKMNRLQQESLAKALGMSRSELAKSAQLELLKAGASKEAIEAAGDMNLAQLEQVDIQTRIKTSLDKLAQAFSPILQAVVPIAEALASVILPIASVIGHISSGVSGLVAPLLTVYGIFKGIQLVNTGILAATAAIGTAQAFIATAKASELGLGLSILANLGFQNAAEMYKLTLMTGGNTLAAIGAAIQQTTLYSMLAQSGAILKNIGKLTIELGVRMGIASAALAANAAVTFGVGVAIAVAAALAGYAALKSMNDGEIGADGRPTLFTGTDTVKLNQKDSIYTAKDGSMKVGTDLLGNKEAASGQSISNTVADMSPVVSELTALRAEMSSILNKILAKEGAVYMDSNKVGRAQVLGSYKSA